MKAKNVPREYKIPSRETIRGPILDAIYAKMRDRQKINLLTEAEDFGL